MFATKILLAMLTTSGYSAPLMTKKAKSNGQLKADAMIGARVPLWVRKFYERQAEAERRKLSDVVRIILTDYAEKRRAA
jgi:hypothetical protein